MTDPLLPTFDHPVPPPSNYSAWADALDTMPVGSSVLLPCHYSEVTSRVIKLLFSRKPYIGASSAGYFTCRASVKGTRVWKLRPMPFSAGQTNATSMSLSVVNPLRFP